jgi:hypothetical protein
VLWCLALFAALQGGLALTLERWRPELRDPEYGTKLRLLSDLRREHPDRPVALVLGGSQVLNGLCPELLPEYRTPLGRPIVFNFGLTQHSPLPELMRLRGLLARGMRPRWVFIEVMPSFLTPEWPAEGLVHAEQLSWSDLALLRPYADDLGQLYGAWLRARVVPWFSWRFLLLNRYLPAWAPPENQVDTWRIVSRYGWLAIHPLAPADRTRVLEVVLDQHLALLDKARVTAVPDRALREILVLCRREGIAAALLVMPEHSRLRRLSPPVVREYLDNYLRGLSRDYRVPLIDARAWAPDEVFRDGLHLLPQGAVLFTERFGREVLEPTFGVTSAHASGARP